ncbi:hypothetical protein ZWY2020_033799 [Hordeum vulgare]|nr:hypothetical protein ZWY2020_033799 [Hordeum vulgare]
MQNGTEGMARGRWTSERRGAWMGRQARSNSNNSGMRSHARESVTTLRGSGSGPLVQRKRRGSVLVAARQQKRHALSSMELASQSKDRGARGTQAGHGTAGRVQVHGGSSQGWLEGTAAGQASATGSGADEGRGGQDPWELVSGSTSRGRRGWDREEGSG